MKAKCPHCENLLPASRFYANRDRPNGLSILCKNCFRAYEATPERRAKRTWNTIKFRASGRNPQKSYQPIRVRITRDEFLSWAIPAYTAWMAQNPGQCPSLDRIDADGDYAIGNLRILERGANSRLARNHPNVHAPPGAAWCHSCKQYLSTENFWRLASAFNGLQKRCKPCQTAATRRP